MSVQEHRKISVTKCKTKWVMVRDDRRETPVGVMLLIHINLKKIAGSPPNRQKD